MFLLATYLVSIIFMNMLIAIMGETYENVTDIRIENGLQEQVNLISNHYWLLNLNQIFKGQKYIMRMTLGTPEGE